MYKESKKMPPFLRRITGGSLACILFLLIIVMPDMPVNFMGKEITAAELWELGFGLPVVAFGLWMPILGVSIIKRWRFSRHVFTLTFISISIIPYIYWKQWLSVLFGIVLSFVLIWYLFTNEKVKEYFKV
ncbi:hypothetical protein ACXJY6_05210 [Vibrio sp. RC27]